jgi:hypothetical protein
LDCNIENSRGQKTLGLGKCADEDYHNDDGKVLFGDDDDVEDNYDHHYVERSFRSCFGSAWQLFPKISIYFLTTISKILRSYWMSHSVFWYMTIDVSEKPASSVIMEEEIPQ